MCEDFEFSHVQKGLLEQGVIAIEGEITEITAEYVHQCVLNLRAQGCPDIDVWIRSIGGGVFEGFEIFDDLRLYPGTTRGIVMGYARSAATIILMALDSRIATRNSLLQVHNCILSDVSTEHLRDREANRVSNAVNLRLGMIYAKRSGKSLATMRTVMDEGRLMSPREAKKLGLIDTII